MRLVLISTALVLLALVCSANDRSKQIDLKNSAQAKPDETLRNTGGERFNINNTRGVVVLNRFSKADFARFYNADGTPWYEFSYFYDDRDGKFEYANDSFRPFAFHQDHFLLALKCTETTEKFLEVVVNEETGLRKYVKANDPVLKLETWEKFVLGVFAVKFDRKANPLRAAPNGQVKSVVVPSEANFRPVAIAGEWLRVRWDSYGKTVAARPDANGWIRWKNVGTLLVDFYYFS